jgi:RNA polymerase primary sigma factor
MIANKYFNNNEESGILKYLKDVRKSEIITQEREIELAKRILEGDEEAVKELAKANLRFVIKIAKNFQNKGLTLLDLISEGNYGLMIAARRFDHTKGYRFISYAVWWIRQQIMQSLNENSRMVRLPANIINKMSKDRKEDSKKVSEEDYETNYLYADTCYLPTLSLSAQINEDGDELIDLLEDTSIKRPDEELLYDNDLRHSVNETLSILTERERNIVECYFGLTGEKMTLEAIGEEYNLTKERVRQIKEKAIRKLRHNSEKLFEFLNK